MELNTVCHQIVSDMKNEENHLNEIQNFYYNTVGDEELFDRWLNSIFDYIEEHFKISSNQQINKLSALILTSTKIIDDSPSSSVLPICPSSNRTVENICKISTLISQPNHKHKLTDFTGKYAKEKLKFLFFDVSLGLEIDPEFFNFTIQFLNKLIEKIELNNNKKKFPIIDMRSIEFMSLTELVRSKLKFTEPSQTIPMIANCHYQSDLRPINCANYHRLGDPHMWIDDNDYYDRGIANRLKKLIGKGFELNKFYYKTGPGFNEFVNEMENDIEFRNMKIQTRLSKNIQINSHFDKWLKTICEDFLTKYYDQFELENLQMIVIGSSGVNNSFCQYNSLRALVAESWFTSIPHAVKTFIANLNKALCLEKQRGKIEKDNPKYDFECAQSMDHVLFINVCHSVKHGIAEEWVNAACSIKFVNKILKKCENLRKIAILDFRITLHTHRDNLRNIDTEESCSKLIEDAKPFVQTCSPIYKKRKIDNSEYRTKYKNLLNDFSPFLQTIGQDTTDVSCDEYYQNEDHFKVVNPHDYHRYVRFGNPGHDHYYSFDQHYYVEQLRELFNEGYAVDKLFEPQK